MGISTTHLIIFLVIIVLMNIGSDLGGAVKGFKDGMKDGEAKAAEPPVQQVAATEVRPAGETIDVESTRR